MAEPKSDAIVVPASVIEAYLKWLRNPKGAAFGFSVLPRLGGVVDVELPLVPIRK
jgi:hypothetical protein